MSITTRRRARTSILASMTGLALATSMWSPALATDTTHDQPTRPDGYARQLAPTAKLHGKLTSMSGPVSVFVQFAGDGAFEQTQSPKVRSGLAKPVKKVDAVKQIRSNIKAKAQTAVKEAGGTELYVTTNTIPGVAIHGDAAKVRELAARPDVVKITPIVPKSPGNKGTDIDTKALNTWVEHHQTGEGVTIAVLDTGIDYTHSDFGGPGTTAAFAQAKKLPALADAVKAGLADPQKIIGGYDLVGDDYNADPAGAESPYQPVPHPDLNPLDCAGHGSHVSGTAAGYGVNADGTTFTGDYSKLSAASVNSMRIGPGSAPEAQLVGIRVFGCAGTSDVVGQALDYVLDPNGDGDFSDRAQVVNMSLGSDFSPVDDPENDIVDALTAQGILSVVASGNAGDIFDVGGSPGNAASALTVANSVGSQISLDRIDVTAPADEAGAYAGQYSANFNYNDPSVTAAQLTGEVVMASNENRFGCDPFSAADAAKMKGKWVWLVWEENGSFPCGSKQRFDNAEKAGAAGVVLDSPRDIFDAGIAGNATIPGVQFNRAGSDALRAAAAAGTLVVKLDPSYLGAATAESHALDTLNSSSSRGVHGSNGIVKPDVAAPGTLIGSVAVGSGNGVAVMTGTSMATPHTAGIAALVYGTGVTDPYVVKSRVMNTAVHDIVTADGTVFAPNRVGSGRVDALGAVSTDVYAFAADNPVLTSVEFGIIEAGANPLSITKNVTVKNTGKVARSYATSYLPATKMHGVAISTSPASVSLRPGGTATVKVTLSIADPTQLFKSIDPTMDRIDPAYGLPRQYLADASGRLQLKSGNASVPTLRVPVHAAPKPASAMSAKKISFSSPTARTAPVQLTGRDVFQGSAADYTDYYSSLLEPFQLGATSPKLPADTLPIPGLRAMDLQYVGASSNVPALKAAGGNVADGVLTFGVSTWADWAALLPSASIAVDIDTNADGKADFRTETSMADGLDLIIAFTTDLKTGETVDAQFANGQAGNVDTNTFDTNVIGLPVSLAALGMTGAKSTPISYTVSTDSWYSTDVGGNAVPLDKTKPIKFNAVTPDLWFSAENPSYSVFSDYAGLQMTAHRGANVKEASALFLHLHNATGKKAEVAQVAIPKPVDPIVHVRASAQSKAVKGTARVSVQAVNQEKVKVDIRLMTPYGQKKFSQVKPGAAVSYVFDSHKRHIPAGTARVAAYKRVKGHGYYTVHNAPYKALTVTTKPGFTPQAPHQRDLKRSNHVDFGYGNATFNGGNRVTLKHLKAGQWYYVYVGHSKFAWHQATTKGTVSFVLPKRVHNGNSEVVAFNDARKIFGWDTIKLREVKHGHHGGGHHRG